MKEKISNSDIRELYNEKIRGKYKNQYEFERWFRKASTRCDYAMTHRVVEQCAGSQTFSRYIEVGPGPGTWTKVFYHACPEADFHLVDISESMREQFHLEMRDQKNVNYAVDDFVSHQFNQQCDVFFSSRALEYFEDKGAFFDKLKDIAEKNCRAYIITKNPSISRLLFGKKSKRQSPPHGGEISVADINKLILARGFSNVVFFPVVTRIPFIGRICPRLREWLFNKMYQKKLSEKWMGFFSESYLVSFKCD
jgi:hypothetical protein